jgi:hypothetical protein
VVFKFVDRTHKRKARRKIESGGKSEGVKSERVATFRLRG